MSITSSVPAPVPRPLRRRRAGALGAMTVVVALATVTGVPAATARPAPAPAVAEPGGSTVAAETLEQIAALREVVAGGASRVGSAVERRDRVARQLDEVRAREAAARARTDELSVVAAEAAARHEASQARLRELAVSAYRDGPRLGTVDAILSADSIVDYARRQVLVDRVGEVQRDIIDDARRDEAAARAAADEARAERERLRQQLDALTLELPRAEQAIVDAEAARAGDQLWLTRWESIAGGTATAIMGPPVVSGEEMARWFRATRARGARTTVPIEELATYYVEEGAAANVRGDIAFAQSILETAAFWFPAGGQVQPTDNNFAGIGACDSCSRGRLYPDARTGVRAQMQLLRVYADPTLRNADLNPPAVDPRLDTHFLKGDVPTWAGLTGTWATAGGYADRILEIYVEMLAWLTARR